eukprot:COSAG03_NODE_1975_length_3273_cov_8.984877_6_plen_56_part_00
MSVCLCVCVRAGIAAIGTSWDAVPTPHIVYEQIYTFMFTYIFDKRNIAAYIALYT